MGGIGIGESETSVFFYLIGQLARGASFTSQPQRLLHFETRMSGRAELTKSTGARRIATWRQCLTTSNGTTATYD